MTVAENPAVGELIGGPKGRKCSTSLPVLPAPEGPPQPARRHDVRGEQQQLADRARVDRNPALMCWTSPPKHTASIVQ